MKEVFFIITNKRNWLPDADGLTGFSIREYSIEVRFFPEDLCDNLEILFISHPARGRRALVSWGLDDKGLEIDAWMKTDAAVIDQVVSTWSIGYKRKLVSRKTGRGKE